MNRDQILRRHDEITAETDAVKHKENKIDAKKKVKTKTTNQSRVISTHSTRRTSRHVMVKYRTP